MSEYQPYAYLIGWSAKDRWYYGIEYGTSRRTANPRNLWESYFTSSKKVKAFRKTHGEPDVIEIRRLFENKNEALAWETKLLTRIGAAESNRWLNANNGGKTFVNCGGYTLSPITIERMRASKLAFYQTEEGLKERKRRSLTCNPPRLKKHTAERNRRISEKQRLPIPDRALLLERYNAFGASLNSVSKLYGVSIPTLRKWLMELQIPRKDRSKTLSEAMISANQRNNNVG